MIQVIEHCMELDAIALRLYKTLEGGAADDAPREFWLQLREEKRERVEQWRILKGGFEAGLVPSPIADKDRLKGRLKSKIDHIHRLLEAAPRCADFEAAARVALQVEAELLDPETARLLKLNRVYALSGSTHVELQLPVIATLHRHKGRVDDASVAFASTLGRLFEMQERLWDREDRDPVTGAHTRRILFQHGQFLLDWAIRYGKPVALLSIQVDDFPSVVRQYGYTVADALLGVLFNRIHAVVRKTDWVVRNAADDFVVLVLGTPQEGLVTLSHRLLAQIRSPAIALGGVDVPVTASIGACLYPMEGMDDPTIELLLMAGAKALEKAREQGGNCLAFAERSMLPSAGN